MANYTSVCASVGVIDVNRLVRASSFLEGQPGLSVELCGSQT